MDVDGELRRGLDGAQEVDAEREVGDEVAIHDVVVQQVGGGDVGELVGEAAEVGGEDRGGDPDLIVHHAFSLSCVAIP